jgi:hypothetical protein
MSQTCSRPRTIAHLVFGAVLLSACQGDRLNSPSTNTEPRTRVFVGGKLRDATAILGVATSSELQAVRTLGDVDELKPLNVRATARRAMTVESTWLDADHLIRQVVTFDVRGLPKSVQVFTPQGLLVVENEFRISGNAASLVRQVIKSGAVQLIERTSVRKTSLSEVALGGFSSLGRGISGTVSACMDGLSAILLPRKAYASTVGDPCASQTAAYGSAHRKALVGAAAAGATCAASAGLVCGIAIAAELDMIHDVFVAKEALEECRHDHPEYVPPEPCTSNCRSTRG